MGSTDCITTNSVSQRSPLSEACKGVLTTLDSLGLRKEIRARDLPAIRSVAVSDLGLDLAPSCPPLKGLSRAWSWRVWRALTGVRLCGVWSFCVSLCGCGVWQGMVRGTGPGGLLREGLPGMHAQSASTLDSLQSDIRTSTSKVRGSLGDEVALTPTTTAICG